MCNFFFFFFNFSLYLESIVDVEGVISAAPEKITGCTQQDVEIQVTKVSILILLIINQWNWYMCIISQCSSTHDRDCGASNSVGTRTHTGLRQIAIGCAH